MADHSQSQSATNTATGPHSRPESRLEAHGPPRKRWRIVTVILAILAVILAAGVVHDARPPELRPLNAKRLIHQEEFQGPYRDRTLWGTYRPGLYFGMRMKQPRSLQTGLMWFDPDRPDALQNIRHQAQERDGLRKFGWERHDGESFGRQELFDGDLHITTAFVKRFCANCRGGDWAVRVDMKEEASAHSKAASSDSEEELPPPKGSLLFYIASDKGGGAASKEGIQVHLDPQKSGEILLASGNSSPLGGWKLHASSSAGKALPEIHYLALNTPHLHNLTDLVNLHLFSSSTMQGRRPVLQSLARSSLVLPNAAQSASNVAIFQVTSALPLSISFAFTGSLTQQKNYEGSIVGWPFRSLKALWKPAERPSPDWPTLQKPSETLQKRVQALSGQRLSELLERAEESFDRKFAATFQLQANSDIPSGTEEVSKAALSNMLGSIGYFHGRQLVKVESQAVEAWPTALLASVPSRSFFPRGFLWDEGFHQILGEEARSRVPAEFVVQDPTAANPPTLFLPLADMARSLGEKSQHTEPQEAADEAAFLTAAFPRLKAWLDWYIRTQYGKLPGSWRWRGRVMEFLTDPVTGEFTSFTRELNPKTLTSGLDDYPRASHPSEEERHVDLLCWMALASKSLSIIGTALNLPLAQVKPYKALAELLSDPQHLNKLHYDERAQQYRDFGNHTEDVRLDWRYIQLPQNWQGMNLPESARRRRYDFVRHVGTPPRLQFVPHYGFVSLFPLLMRLLPPESPELGSQLKHLKSGGILSPFGLQSLSTSSSIYMERNTEHDLPYWRGPIWININFLVLASLHHYSQAGGANGRMAQELHDTLRERLLQLTVSNYEASGFLWENYEQEKGTGRGCRPFTGWTALLVLIASRNYSEL